MKLLGTENIKVIATFQPHVTPMQAYRRALKFRCVMAAVMIDGKMKLAMGRRV